MFPHIEPDKEPTKLSHLSRCMKQLDQYLEENSELCLICLDEYERLGPRIKAGDLRGLADSLRSWIQHLRNVIFLFAGSHQFSELPDIDWTDYLINVRTVPISFLDHDAAVKLVTSPIPEYKVSYENIDLPIQMVRRLGLQPYLIQSTMFELTELLNADGNRRNITESDVDQAIKAAITSVKNHFEHLWKSELDEASRETIRRFTNGQNISSNSASLRKLEQREVLRSDGHSWDFCIPAFREWLYSSGKI